MSRLADINRRNRTDHSIRHNATDEWISKHGYPETRDTLSERQSVATALKRYTDAAVDKHWRDKLDR